LRARYAPGRELRKPCSLERQGIGILVAAGRQSQIERFTSSIPGGRTEPQTNQYNGSAIDRKSVNRIRVIAIRAASYGKYPATIVGNTICV